MPPPRCSRCWRSHHLHRRGGRRGRRRGKPATLFPFRLLRNRQQSQLIVSGIFSWLKTHPKGHPQACVLSRKSVLLAKALRSGCTNVKISRLHFNSKRGLWARKNCKSCTNTLSTELIIARWL